MSNVSVFGLGYVGVVSAACLVNKGHKVIGVDPVKDKVDMLNAGKSPIIEEGLAELIEAGRLSRRLRATMDPMKGVLETEMSLCWHAKSIEW